jgi:hypothetical protein
MQYYTTEEVNRSDFPGRKDMVALHPAPLHIKARSSRRWKYFGKKGYWVTLRLLGEQGRSLQWTGFVESLHVISQSLTLSEQEAIWSIRSSVEGDIQKDA